MKLFIFNILLLCFTSASAQRFFGIDYLISTPQTPVSDKYNLEGELVSFSEFSADLSYGWHLDEKKENTVLLATLLYSQMKSNINLSDSAKSRFEKGFPEYVYGLPNIRGMGLNLLFNQTLKNNWDFTINYATIYSSDFKSSINKGDFNSIGILYFQKKLKNFTVGAGSAIYYLDKKIKAFPVGSISYKRDKLDIDFLPPLSLGINYDVGDKTELVFSGGLDFSGFEVNYSNANLAISSRPDYIQNTDLNFEIGIDRVFLETLHWSLSIGYFYREMSFMIDRKLIDKLVFQNGLTLNLGIYSTF
jgi:hypothetical protein